MLRSRCLKSRRATPRTTASCTPFFRTPDGTYFIFINFYSLTYDHAFHPDVQIPPDSFLQQNVPVALRLNPQTNDVLWARALLDVFQEPGLSLDGATSAVYLSAGLLPSSQNTVVKKLSATGRVLWSRVWGPFRGIDITFPYSLRSNNPVVFFASAKANFAAAAPRQAPYVVPMWKRGGNWGKAIRMAKNNVTDGANIEKFDQQGSIVCAAGVDSSTRGVYRTSLRCASFKGNDDARTIALGDTPTSFQSPFVALEPKKWNRQQAVYALRRVFVTGDDGEKQDILELTRRDVGTLRKLPWRQGSWSNRQIQLPTYENDFGVSITNMHYIEQSRSVAVLFRTNYNMSEVLRPMKGGFRMVETPVTVAGDVRFYWILQFNNKWKPKLLRINPVEELKRNNISTSGRLGRRINQILSFEITPDGKSFVSILQFVSGRPWLNYFFSFPYKDALPIVP